VQTPVEMMDAIDEKVRALNAIADRLYDHWRTGLKAR